MSQTLDTLIRKRDAAQHTLSYEAIAGRDVQEAERVIDRFVSELRRMTSAERIRASRYSFNRWERWVWSARYPEEVPLVNGEPEWIGLNLADND
jgi:hypothetical protein